MEPEQFAELLDHIRMVAHRVIPAHGGDLIRMDGDGMLCLFGFPEPHEDAGRRATEAAIDMQAAISALDLGFASPDRRLRLHSGVHAGMVLLIQGDLVRGKYEVLGDATNIAARIRDAAGPGEILVSTQSLGGERHLFVTGPPRAVAVRGRPTALDCLPVLGRTATRRRFDARLIAGLTPFQGRDAESSAFAQWLASADSGRSVFYVHGPAGIGKSRLLQMMTRQAKLAGWPVVQGYCEAYLGARPLQPFHQAVSKLSPPASTDDLEEALAAAGRLLLVIDDWQWADDASRDLLGRLLSRTDAANLRCVLASREKYEVIPGIAPINDHALPPLDRDAVLSVIESLLRSPDPFDVSRIEQAAGGSPLLIEELCHAFAAGLGTNAQDVRGGWFDLIVQARFDRLTPQDQQLLKLTAVIGHMVPIWLIETLQGQALDDQQLGRLQQADFLFRGETGDTYRFKHGLTRESLYAAIGMEERKALHANVLAALEAGVSEHPAGALLDGLAYHAIASGNAVKGLPYAIAAGDAALAAGALDRAQGHYLAALDLVPGLADSKARRDAAWTLINKYGLACIIDPAPDQLPVLERAQAILAEHGSTRDMMRAAYWLGSIAYGVGLGKRSVRHLEDALALAEQGGTADDVLLIQTKLAQSCFISGQLARAAALHEQLLPRLHEAVNRNQREVSAYAHANYAFLQSERGNYGLAADFFNTADEILSDGSNASNASILLYRAAALVSQGQWQDAVVAASAVLAMSQRSRTRMQSRNARAQAAYANWKLKGSPQHVEDLDRIACEYSSIGNSRQNSSMVFGWVVETMVDLGRIDRAQLFMGEVVARTREGGDRLGTAMAWRALALAAQQAGDTVRADRRLAAAQRSVQRHPSRREAAHNMVCQARLWQARGQTAAADTLLHQAAAEFAAMAMPWFHDQAVSLMQAGPEPAAPVVSQNH